ncbi:NAD-dependent epimerase/dehydratase family protein [Neomoorella humiferrea]|uniref:NAD-dependent epimerase/dehydratase family protein n=1 Tax=Neomoorella humiferrea TaxID=676965 RepID=UPI003D9270F2
MVCDSQWDLVLEKALASYSRAYNFRAISLRYFNAAGASSAGDIGEDHDPETHLIPLVLRAIMTGKELTVFGDDYPTPDGTAVRDYIHVDDLAAAYVLALEALEQGSPTSAYNLGTGRGYSVLEVIKAAEKVTGQKVPYRVGPRRPGDPAVLVASAEKAMAELGWRPRYTELEDIITTAWQWHRRKPLGFNG